MKRLCCRSRGGLPSERSGWWPGPAPLALLALVIVGATALRAADAAVIPPVQADRGRVKVERTHDGYLTVHSDQGTPLRGGLAFVYKSGRKAGKTAYISDPAYYQKMRDGGLNAVRLIA